MQEIKKDVVYKIKEHIAKINELLNEFDKTDVSVETKKVVTLEEVRTVLANLSRDGFTKEVKDLLRKHGSEKLSTINQSEYEALLVEAGEIGNAK